MNNEQAFINWMHYQHKLGERTTQSRLSNCRRIEKYEGDLDSHYDADQCAMLLQRLSYTRDDANAKRRVRHSIPIDGDQYNGTATLCSALQLYITFRKSHGLQPASASTIRISQPANTMNAAAKPPAQRRSNTVGTANWPVWETPSTDAMLALARQTTPYLRFLHPEIIAAIVEDTERHRTNWSDALQHYGIDPAMYLWERGACAFPGIRRYSGSSEIAMHRKRMAHDAITLSGALKTDDNSYPKHLWSFMLRGRPFQNYGPDDYELAHLLDHKGDQQALTRLNQEITHPGQQSLDTPIYGLFTSAANSVYLPKALIRPTDFSPPLRSLIQRRARQLYGTSCQLVPAPWAIRDQAVSDWSLEAFIWAEPVGSLQYLKQFLAFRHEQMARLLTL